jgi:hypothetical protein
MDTITVGDRQDHPVEGFASAPQSETAAAGDAAHWESYKEFLRGGITMKAGIAPVALAAANHHKDNLA